jgi:uncharacterized protein (DUF1800 family)
MYKDGAMLHYLDGDPNSKRRPNENFARENFELFTTGVGPYTEIDVKEAARAFTGYDVSEDNVVSFNAADHDSNNKTILGQTGNWGGDDVMRIAFARPETRRVICTKLYKFFVSERLNVVDLTALMRAWSQTNGNLQAVMLTLFRLAGFWDPRNRGFLVKSSAQYAIGLVQRLGLTPDVALIGRMLDDMNQMGQSPFQPPNVAGYPSGIRLTGASMLLTRYHFAYHVIYEKNAAGVTALMTAGLPASPTREQLVATLAERLGVVNLGAATRSAILDWIGTGAITSSNLQSRTLGTLYLLAASPEFQMI